MSVDPQTRAAIREAFLSGNLRVQAVDLDTSEVGLHVVTDVMRHKVGHKRALRVRSSMNVAPSDAGDLQNGFREVVVTEDHSLFKFDQGWLRAVKAEELHSGQWVAAVVPRGGTYLAGRRTGRVFPPGTAERKELGLGAGDPAAKGEHGAVLQDLPTSHLGEGGGPDGVTDPSLGTTDGGDPAVGIEGGAPGRLWPSQVLEIVEVPRHEYMYDLCVPGPQNFVLSNGLLAHNSYSIGGISLDIQKASTYESLKQNAEQQFDKATESKQSTVKVIRGLKQSRFGMGVRSAFGPFTGRGTLGPRSFV